MGCLEITIDPIVFPMNLACVLAIWAGVGIASGFLLAADLALTVAPKIWRWAKHRPKSKPKLKLKLKPVDKPAFLAQPVAKPKPLVAAESVSEKPDRPKGLLVCPHCGSDNEAGQSSMRDLGGQIFGVCRKCARQCLWRKPLDIL